MVKLKLASFFFFLFFSQLFFTNFSLHAASKYCTMVNRIGAKLPAEITHTLQPIEVRNQEDAGTCWLHSALTELEYDILNRTGEKIALSADYLLYNYLLDWSRAQLNEKTDEAMFVVDGAFTWDADNLVKDYGLVPKSSWQRIEGKSWNDLAEHAKKIVEEFHKADYPYNTHSQESAKAYGIIQDFLIKEVGKPPKKFQHSSKNFTAESFRDKYLKGRSLLSNICFVTNQLNQWDSFLTTDSGAIPQPQFSRSSLMRRIQRSLLEGKAVRVTVNWGDRLEDTGGVVRITSERVTPGKSDHHAVTLVGFKTKDNSPLGEVIGLEGQNSWGLHSGYAGRYYFDTNQFWKVFRYAVFPTEG